MAGSVSPRIEARKPLMLSSGSVPCSVCLEPVTDVGERSIAKLKCGHHFHLDCIGSAFNAKGSMQCPNCRHVEDGRWLYANGGRSHEDFGFEELTAVYEDAYEVYDMFHPHHDVQFGHFQWCPYPHFSVTLEEIEAAPSGYPDVVVNVLYNDHGAGSNSSQVCPYLAAQHSRNLHAMDDSLVAPRSPMEIPMPVPSRVPVAANPTGPHGFFSAERGWMPHAPTLIPSSSTSDVGLPANERSRWTTTTSNTPALHSGYNIMEPRASENGSSSWQNAPILCPQNHHIHQVPGGSGQSQPQGILLPPGQGYAHSFSSPRRSRHRGLTNTRTLQGDRSNWNGSPSVGQDVGTAASNGIPWSNNGTNHSWRRNSHATWAPYNLESQWCPWPQPSNNQPVLDEPATAVYRSDIPSQSASRPPNGPINGVMQCPFPGFPQGFGQEGPNELHMNPFCPRR